MRNDFPSGQLSFYQLPIEDIEINFFSKDEMSSTLLGIQDVYKNKALRTEILSLIRGDFEKDNTSTLGAKGLSLWEVFVLVMVRQAGANDYNKLSDLAENHFTLMGIMGYSFSDQARFPVSTINDNITKVQTQTIDKINTLIVKHAHKNCPSALDMVRSDSFVLESNIHLHADYVSLYDGTRCLMRESKRLAELCDISGFRKYKAVTKKSKQLSYKITQVKRSKKRNKGNELLDSLVDLLNHTQDVMDRVLALLEDTMQWEDENEKKMNRYTKLRNKLVHFLSGTALEHELTHRRRVLGETLLPKEKIYSLFEPHTELIMKGKSKAPVEFGHLVFVAQDNAGFMLTGSRMESGHRDKDVCIPEMIKLQADYDNKIKCGTFDKGFCNPANKKAIIDIFDDHYLPSTGNKNIEERTADYYKKKHWHSGVESSINALEQGNNLGVCRDKGLEGFDRCIAASVASRNLHTLGRKIAEALKKKQKKQAA